MKQSYGFMQFLYELQDDAKAKEDYYAVMAYDRAVDHLDRMFKGKNVAEVAPEYLALLRECAALETKHEDPASAAAFTEAANYAEIYFAL